MNFKRWILAISVVPLMISLSMARDFPRDTTYTVYQSFQKLQKKYPNVKIVSEEIPFNIKVTKDIIYSSFQTQNFGLRNLKLDIYQLNDLVKRPVVIMIHGGGWRSGDKSMERGMAIKLANAGYVAIPVEYRLSLEAKYPSAVQDIKAAIRWVKLNADMYSVDTTKIAIEGSSAGGQLATLVGMTSHLTLYDDYRYREKASSKVQAVIDIDGVVDFMAPASLNMTRTQSSADVTWLGSTFEDNPKVWKEASPIYYVNEKSVPILFINSTQHRFHAGEDEMVGLLAQNGIYNEVKEIPNAPHTFWLVDPWHSTTVAYMINFLNRTFK